ncbi:MAG: GYD domain-containing protein [Gammaproteobacteria bacterium]
MATYVLLSTLTPEGRLTMHKNPDRLQQVNKEIEALGCKVTAQYAVLGIYDFVTIVEAPDNETAAHLSIDLGSRGTVNLMTLPAMTVDDLRKKLQGPAQIGHT